jgi:hypothetical protein
MTKEIQLTKGMKTIVDEEDYDWLRKYRWSASADAKHKGTHRAKTTLYKKMDDGFTWRRSEHMHRMIMGAKRGEIVDHVNGDPLDNRRSNLRLATHAENCQNGKKGTYRGKPCLSKYKGVSKRSSTKNGKKYSYWIGQIVVDGQHINLGNFKTEEDAARAYDEAAKEHFGEFAKCNF